MDMKRSGSLFACLGIGLLALNHWESSLPRVSLLGYLRRAVIEARGRTRIDGRKADNGYYENLMGGGEGEDEDRSRPITFLMHGKLPRTGKVTRPYRAADFIVYEGRPGLDFVHPTEGPIKTNSYGFFDREHTLVKPPGVMRIAILGDSIARGWRLPYEQRFDNVLEQRLNESGRRFEVLNFAVAGYRLTQSIDVALERAAQFNPDLYIVTLTELTVGENWSAHIAQLVRQNRDLKYDFIRDVVKNSGIQKGDSPALSAWKLAPYRTAVFSRDLQVLSTAAEQASARVVVVLLPAAEDTDITMRRFHGVREELAGTGIPVIDLLSTFDGTDVESMRVAWYDPHPNEVAHRLLANQLYARLYANSSAPGLLTSLNQGNASTSHN
jgi:hypothetical protein